MLKKLKYVVVVLILGIVFSMFVFMQTATAESLRKINTDIATQIAMENYDEYHIHPMVVAAIMNGESKGNTAGTGRPFGMNGRRYYDTAEGTYAFLNLIRYNSWYGDCWKYDDWQSQLWAIEHCGYCESYMVSEYMNYLYAIISTYNLMEYDEKFKEFQKEKKRKEIKRKNRLKRKQRQKRIMTLVFDPTLAPWQVITHRGVVKSGTLRFKHEVEHFTDWQWMDVVDTKKGNKLVIYTGNKMLAMTKPAIYLEEVIEEAVG